MKRNTQHLKAIQEKMNQLSISEGAPPKRLEDTYMLFSFFIEQLTENDTIGFTTLFSRIAYLSTMNDMPGRLTYESQLFRRLIESRQIPKGKESALLELGLYLIQAISEQCYDFGWERTFGKPELTDLQSNSEKLEYQRVVKAAILEVKEDKLVVLLDEDPDRRRIVHIANDEFSQQFSQVQKFFDLPLIINLVDVDFRADGTISAQAMVLRPDFLFGVTSISECFSASGVTALKYLGRKLIPSDSSVHMLIGNVVNFYLDELIHNPQLEFKELLKETFQIAPEMFSIMSDQEVKDCVSKVQVHFNNLKSVVSKELTEVGITKERSYLEPSFYSSEFGLQGRLDLYHHDRQNEKTDIVELKSGKLYQAHKYGLNQNHYVQTLLYDLVLESVHNGKVKSKNYILYSANDSKRLRFAPKVRGKQLEALRLRNSIIILEEILSKLDRQDIPDILDKLNPERIPENYTFLRRDAKKFWELYGKLSILERKYYKTFVAFITRELQLSKVGRHGIYSSNGLASLWLDPMVEKADMFTILSYLEVVKNDTEKRVPTLTLNFSENSNRLSKFRVGDITVLYPNPDETNGILSTQLFKCTILKLDNQQVTVRLRARQKNYEIFRSFKYWNLESDSLTSGFNKQYHGLFDFMMAPKDFRSKVLMVAPPAPPDESVDVGVERMTAEQNKIMSKAIAAKDYFLLWGPPGTGKTSIMISELVKYYYEHTDQEILLLAYTNRAVDEICSAIHSNLVGKYVRIGSRYATAEKYRSNLLSSRIEDISSRATLKNVFSEHRIFVSTISSFQSKREMKKLKKFDLVIIDEASQLLEPMLVGLLSAFRKFILIGDHKQLPAVVTQTEDKSQVRIKELRDEIGLVDCRMSLFERMYKQCIQQQWTWAYGQLTYQGRMHEHLLKLVSAEFYDDKLSVLPGLERLTSTLNYITETELQEVLAQQRILFIDTPKGQSITRKTNLFEAQKVVEITNAWKRIYELNGIEFNEDSVGIITPFRSQIAMIKSQADFDAALPVTVDTIERYQGGARNQIIISLAVNDASLLESISNVSEEGVDRKLNVALTRAREHVVIIGNKEMLMRKDIYRRLIEYSFEYRMQIS